MPATEVYYRRKTMQAITDYTRHNYRDINRNLLSSIVTEQAAELIEIVSHLPTAPGTTYRAFWVDDLKAFSDMLQVGKISFRAFTSTSRSRAVAQQFNGNVRLTIEGQSGRDIAPFSDAPNEQETLFLPGRTFRVVRIKRNRIAGKIGSIDAELIEV